MARGRQSGAMGFWEFLDALPFWMLLLLLGGVYWAYQGAVEYWYYVVPATALAAGVVGVVLYRQRHALTQAEKDQLRAEEEQLRAGEENRRRRADEWHTDAELREVRNISSNASWRPLPPWPP